MTADTFWWQTSRARLVAGLPVGLSLWAVCSFRMRWAVRQYDLRLEERMRIARELHDTLLQGRLSAHMQLHIAVGRLRSNDPRGAALRCSTRVLSPSPINLQRGKPYSVSGAASYTMVSGHQNVEHF